MKDMTIKEARSLMFHLLSCWVTGVLPDVRVREEQPFRSAEDEMAPGAQSDTSVPSDTPE